MSNILNLLGGLAESNEGQINPFVRCTTSHEIKSFKTMGGTKPKGLSIRSNSDMNVSNIQSAKKSIHDKEQDCSKLKPTQIDSHGCPLSPIKPIVRSRTSHEIRSFRTVGGTKSKGLSIRSNSDMNVSNIQSAKKSIHDKEQDCSKLKPTQIDSHGRPISPGKEIPAKNEIVQSSKIKECSLKKDSTINKCTKKQLNDDVFKKPLLPKKNIKKFPKQEKLAYWYDNQHDFDYGYIEAVEKEFKDLFSKEKENIKPCKDNILSDPETLLLLDIVKLTPDKTLDEEHEKRLSSNLLEVSDISDDENP